MLTNTFYEKITIFQKKLEDRHHFTFFKISPVSDLVENSYILLSDSALFVEDSHESSEILGKNLIVCLERRE